MAERRRALRVRQTRLRARRRMADQSRDDSKPQANHVASVLKDLSERWADEEAVRQPAQDAEWRRVVHTILHDRALAVGAKRVLVPPEAVRASLLKIDKASTRLPARDARAPSHRQWTDADAIVDGRAIRHRWNLPLDGKLHGGRRDQAEVRGFREERER